MRKTHLMTIILVITILVLHSESRASRISDQQKKEIVYQKYSDFKKAFPMVQDIHPRKAMELWEQGKVLFVDTRTPAEMSVSMLPAAITVDSLLTNINAYRHKTIVSYCTISKRSGVFAKEMFQMGITVTNLKGGKLAWLLEGGKVYDKKGMEVYRTHVYDDEWNLAPAGYKTEKFNFLDKLLQIR